MSQLLWRLGGEQGAAGPLLAAERERQGITQGELARRLGIAQSNLSRIEKGADLRLSTLLDIARVLNLEPMLVPKRAVRGVRTLLDDLGRPTAGAGGKEPPDHLDAVPKRGRFT